MSDIAEKFVIPALSVINGDCQGCGIPKVYLEPQDPVPEVWDKFEKAAKMMKDGSIRVIILTGSAYKMKEHLAVLFLYRAALMDRTLRFYNSTTLKKDTDINDAHSVVFMGMDDVKGLIPIRIHAFLLGHLARNRIAIIECASKDTLEDAYGERFMDIIASISLEVHIATKRPQIPVIS